MQRFSKSESIAAGGVYSFGQLYGNLKFYIDAVDANGSLQPFSYQGELVGPEGMIVDGGAGGVRLTNDQSGVAVFFRCSPGVKIQEAVRSNPLAPYSFSSPATTGNARDITPGSLSWPAGAVGALIQVRAVGAYCSVEYKMGTNVPKYVGAGKTVSCIMLYSKSTSWKMTIKDFTAAGADDNAKTDSVDIWWITEPQVEKILSQQGEINSGSLAASASLFVPFPAVSMDLGLDVFSTFGDDLSTSYVSIMILPGGTDVTTFTDASIVVQHDQPVGIDTGSYKTMATRFLLSALKGEGKRTNQTWMQIKNNDAAKAVTVIVGWGS